MEILTIDTKTKLNNYRDEFLKAQPNIETIDDPNYVIEDGSTEPVPQIAKYTDAQWADEVVLRFLKRQVQIGKRKIYTESFIDEEAILK